MEKGSGRDLKLSAFACSRIGSTYQLPGRCLPDQHFETSRSRAPTASSDNTHCCSPHPDRVFQMTH